MPPPERMQRTRGSPPAFRRAPVKVEHKIVAAFAVAFLVFVLVGIVIIHEARAHGDHNQWVVHTYEVLDRINGVSDAVDQIESGGRGYLLTGKRDYLEPYETGINNAGARLEELRRLTADNPIQQTRIDRLQTLVNRAISYLHDKIETRQRAGLAAVAPLIGTASKENVDQVRFATGEMKRTENELLDQRNKESEQSAHLTLTSFVLFLALALMMLGTFFFFIWHDLAARRRAEDALRTSDARFRGVLDGAPDAMVISDAAGAIQMVNSQAVTLFGYSREDFSGRTLDDLLMRRDAPGESEPEPDQKASDRVVTDFQALAAKYDGVRKSGDLFPIDMSRRPLEVAGQQWLISAIRDRTEQERAEEALGKYSLDLARSNAELERFAYVASHDLQEPLRMVSSYTQLLSRRYKGKLDSNADEFIAYAVDGASRMQKLINDLLALSRVGTQAQPSEPVDTGVTLRRVLSDLKGTIEAAEATVDSPGQMPTVLADGTQIGQLFQNLIGNALKFRGPQPPRVEITVEPAEGNFWRFSFRDNGIGIEPQYFERIFVIFQRLHGKENYPGTGIGLAICKKIVERHGGHLRVESEPGQGANFLFTLPAAV